MAPPKKRRSAGTNNKVGTLVADVKDVAPARVILRDWINDLYQHRHGSDDTKAWPVEAGGSFLAIVQRAWSDPSRLVEDSTKFLQEISLIPSDASNEHLQQKWCLQKARKAS